jgi:hypothetical protein
MRAEIQCFGKSHQMSGLFVSDALNPPSEMYSLAKKQDLRSSTGYRD